jgi:hypothetical protein
VLLRVIVSASVAGPVHALHLVEGKKSPLEKSMGAETLRLQEARTGKVPWKKCGQYLIELRVRLEV